MSEPVLVEALADTLSICAGRVYQFTEYEDEYYAKWGERHPHRREGTIEGIGGTPPCCVGYPKHLTRPLDPPKHFDWM